MEYCCEIMFKMQAEEFIEPPGRLHSHEKGWLGCFGFADMGGCYKEMPFYYCPFCGTKLRAIKKKKEKKQ